MKDPALERNTRDPYGWRSEQNRRLRELSGDPRCNPGRCRVCGAIVKVAHSREVDPPLAGAQYVIVCGSAYCMTARPLEGPLRCAGPIVAGDQGIEVCETCGDCVCCNLHVIHFDARRECFMSPSVNGLTARCVLKDHEALGCHNPDRTWWATPDLGKPLFPREV